MLYPTTPPATPPTAVDTTAVPNSQARAYPAKGARARNIFLESIY